MAAYQCRRQIVSFPSALILAACIVLLSVAFSIILSGEARTAANDLLAVLVDLLASLGLFYAAQRSANCGKHVALAWTVLALGLLTHTVGDIIWTITEIVYHQAPFPSLADGLVSGPVSYLSHRHFSLAQNVPDLQREAQGIAGYGGCDDRLGHTILVFVDRPDYRIHRRIRRLYPNPHRSLSGHGYAASLRPGRTAVPKDQSTCS